jgi:hypothetical protein
MVLYEKENRTDRNRIAVDRIGSVEANDSYNGRIEWRIGGKPNLAIIAVEIQQPGSLGREDTQ